MAESFIMVTVRPARSSEQIPALELLFSRTDNSREEVEGLLETARRGEISLAELMLAEVDGQAVGAGLLTVQPGRVGFVWPPGVPAHQPKRPAIEDAILKGIARRLDELKLCYGQVILDPEDSTMRAVLERNGFPHLTHLHYMLCPAGSAPVHEPEGRFEAEPFEADINAERFARVLERTYVGTLDCPELDGLRTAEDALAAHQATGRFDPGLWRLFRHQEQDAGLLLINHHPERDLWEIVYLGVVPEARGAGLGTHLVQRAIADARRVSRPIVLAVDARNSVARRIYERWGFLDLTVQSVHLRQAAGSGPDLQFTDYAHRPGTGKRNS
jgi:GNAT superfamily N-acetyltransferase